MDFETLERRALDIRHRLARWEEQRYGRGWTLEELVLGLVGDVGDLAKLIQAHEGVRRADNVHALLEHELSDVLWSVIVIAHRLGIDLPAAFLRTMDDIAAAVGEPR
jgi:NTP pyrophosphatase (non-canonical NTP hydrolase)